MNWEIQAEKLSEIAAAKVEFPYNIWWENNYQMHKEYPQLQVLTDILQNGSEVMVVQSWKLYMVREMTYTLWSFMVPIWIMQVEQKDF